MENLTDSSPADQSLLGPDLYGSEKGFLSVYLVLLICTTMAGNIGNILVIGAVTMDRRLRTVGNVFILNLALADLCVTGFVDPFSILGVFIGHEWFLDHPALCHVIGSVCLVSCVCSLWSIAAISVNRYILLCKPAIYKRVYTWKQTIGIAVGLWLGASLLDLPNFLDWGDHTYDMKTMACSYDRLASYSYTVFFIMMFVTVPLITVLFCNVNIYVVVVQSKIRVARHVGPAGEYGDETSVTHVGGSSGEAGSSEGREGGGGGRGNKGVSVIAAATSDPTRPNPNQLQVPTRVTASFKKPSRRKLNMKNEVKLAKTLFIIFIIFCLCWTPYALLCLIDRHDRALREAYAFTILFAHASSSLNSVLYAVTNRGFRDGYVMVLRKLGCKCFNAS